MGVNSLARDTIANTVKYSSALAGNDTADIALSSDFLIQEVILNGTASTVSFNLSGIDPTYKHLQLRMVDRQTGASGMVSAAIRFNADSGSNYSWHRLYATGGGMSSNAGSSQSDFIISGVPAGNETANVWAGAIVDILDFNSTSKFKTVRALSGAVGSAKEIYLSSGNWRSLSAVTSIDINVQSTAHATGSRFSLYGSKG